MREIRQRHSAAVLSRTVPVFCVADNLIEVSVTGYRMHD